jgi:hypothetical protein
MLFMIIERFRDNIKMPFDNTIPPPVEFHHNLTSPYAPILPDFLVP